MGLLVVGLLAALWAVVLLPGLLRSGRDFSPAASVDRFERGMGVLAQTRRAAGGVGESHRGRQVLVLARPADVVLGAARSRTVQRRRAVLGRFGAAAAVTSFLAAIFGGWLWWAVVVSVVALISYVGVLVQLRSGQQTRKRKVHDLSERRAQAAARRRMAFSSDRAVGADGPGA